MRSRRWKTWLVVAALILTAGCAQSLTIKPSICLPPPRPPLQGDEMTPEFKRWVVGLAECQEQNCTAIAVLRGEDWRRCQVK